MNPSMHVMELRAFGDPEEFQVAERPVPRPEAGQVLVRVAATSVNPIDTKIRAGAVPGIAPALPAILHVDVAGTVAAVGLGVTRFREGDAVYGFAGGVKERQGALAEYVVVPEGDLAPAPRNLPLAEVAALPVVAATAWEALFMRKVLAPGMRVLIHGGTGGVGHIALQLARRAGCQVSTTVSTPAKAELARSLGADEIIYYLDETVSDYVQRLTGGQGFDVVFDTVGGANLGQSFAATRVNGNVLAIAARGQHDLSLLHARGLSLHVVFSLAPLVYGVNPGRIGDILTAVTQSVELGSLKPLIDPQRYALVDVAAAHRAVESGAVVGKALVVVPA